MESGSIYKTGLSSQKEDTFKRYLKDAATIKMRRLVTALSKFRMVYTTCVAMNRETRAQKMISKDRASLVSGIA